MREDIGVASHDRCGAETRVTLLYPPSHTSVKRRMATEFGMNPLGPVGVGDCALNQHSAGKAADIE